MVTHPKDAAVSVQSASVTLQITSSHLLSQRSGPKASGPPALSALCCGTLDSLRFSAVPSIFAGLLAKQYFVRKALCLLSASARKPQGEYLPKPSEPMAAG